MVALLIGVSREKEVAAGRCNLPQRSPQVVSGNVEAIAEVLQQAEILINPTHEKMRQSIEQLFRHQSGDDLRLLYFCGAATIGKTGKLYLSVGLSVGSSESASPTQQRQSWTDEPTMISLDWVLELMEQSHSEKVAVILDCVDVINEKPQLSEKISCRSFTKGALLSHITLNSKKISQENFHRKALLAQLEVVTRQDDFPTYTDYLVAGLATGEADLDGDGVISLAQWHEYAKSELQFFLPRTGPKIYAAGNAGEIAIATTSSISPGQEYRHTVAELAKRHNGTLPVVAERSLDVRRDRLGVKPAIATSIQKTVLAAYRYQQAKLQLYQQLWQEVTETQGAITPEIRDRLKYCQQVLGLADAEISALEQAMPKSSSSDDRLSLPLLIMAGLAIALLFGGGSYALIRTFTNMRSAWESCSEENCVAPNNQPKPSVSLPPPAGDREPKPSISLPPPPADLIRSQLRSQTLNGDPLTSQFRIPTEKPITLTDHAGPVQSVAISPDRQILVTGSSDKTIKLWNLAKVWQTDPQKAIDQSTFLTGTWRGHTNTLRSLAISADGQTLASGSNDRTIKLWNLAPEIENRGNGRNDEAAYLRSTLTDHLGPVYAMAFLPNQNILISGSGDWTIKIWDLTTNQAIKTLRGHRGAIRALAVSPDGHTLVTGSSDRTVKVWDLRTRKLKQTLRGHTDLVRTVAISPDGQTIASGSWDRTVKIWTLPPQMEISNYNQGKNQSLLLRGTLTGHSDRVNSVVFGADGQTLISGSDDNTIKVWQLHLDPGKPDQKNSELATLSATLTDHSSDILALAVSGYDGQFSNSYPLIVSGSWDETLKIWW